MPVTIDSVDPFSDDEFNALQQQKRRRTNPAMDELLAQVATGQPVRVLLVAGQSARGLRVAISRAATALGLRVETVEGDGFVAVRTAAEPQTRPRQSTPKPEGQKRRGRPLKRQAEDTSAGAALDLTADKE